MAMSWSPITRGSSFFSNGAVLMAIAGSSGRMTRCHTAPSCIAVDENGFHRVSAFP